MIAEASVNNREFTLKAEILPESITQVIMRNLREV
jgi:hypothetical protein